MQLNTHVDWNINFLEAVMCQIEQEWDLNSAQKLGNFFYWSFLENVLSSVN